MERGMGEDIEQGRGGEEKEIMERGVEGLLLRDGNGKGREREEEGKRREGRSLPTIKKLFLRPDNGAVHNPTSYPIQFYTNRSSQMHRLAS